MLSTQLVFCRLHICRAVLVCYMALGFTYATTHPMKSVRANRGTIIHGNDMKMSLAPVTSAWQSSWALLAWAGASCVLSVAFWRASAAFFRSSFFLRAALRLQVPCLRGMATVLTRS